MTDEPTGTDWLRAVSDSGWVVEGRDGDRLVIRCPAVGCRVQAMIAPGSVPAPCDPGARRGAWDHPVADYEELKLFLRQRRQDLGFTIEDVDQAAGWPSDRYVSKLEVGASKTVTMPTLVLWAGALGYELVLRPTPLPPVARRILAGKMAPA